MTGTLEQTCSASKQMQTGQSLVTIDSCKETMGYSLPREAMRAINNHLVDVLYLISSTTDSLSG